jgi:hypothetical protein
MIIIFEGGYKPTPGLEMSLRWIYASVWNAYNQKNIAEYFWNNEDQEVKEVYQWGLLPIVGVEWEF